MFEIYFILLFFEFILFHCMEMKRSQLVKLETSLNYKKADADFKKASETQQLTNQ